MSQQELIVYLEGVLQDFSEGKRRTPRLKELDPKQREWASAFLDGSITALKWTLQLLRTN